MTAAALGSEQSFAALCMNSRFFASARLSDRRVSSIENPVERIFVQVRFTDAGDQGTASDSHCLNGDDSRLLAAITHRSPAIRPARKQHDFPVVRVKSREREAHFVA